FNVLRILRGAGDPLPTMEVADRMIEPEPGITRLIERLRIKGLVERLPDPDDGRRSLCSITDEGLRVLRRLDDPIAVMDDEVLGALNERQLKSLIRLLDKARAAMVP
ncbi:MAG: winged helix DNA-binding protein, partial [Rhodothermia bacterium]|nr:winged helix DNA-binding protein [Rhodothermia bacterium]